jgi:next-to-BRCA1 protein 1
VLSSSNVQTVVDVKPEQISTKEEQPVEKVEAEESETKPTLQSVPAASADLVAVFVKDTVADGTVMEPNHVFEQTWVLRNEGKTAWPAGCSVMFVGGDYMGHVDSNHPAATQDLRASNVSTVCYSPIFPGEEFPFTVLLRTPLRAGRIVSNWRLTTPDGLKFGHRLWCDVKVEHPKVLPPTFTESVKEEREVTAKTEPEVATKEKSEPQHSQMIFPKLEKESPVASLHEDANSDAPAYEEYEDCEDDDWDAAESDEAFLTDEEYDILDASDEEYIEARSRK